MVDEERYWKIYSIVIDWIKFADTKASVFIALNTGIVAFFASEIINNESFKFIKNNPFVWIPLLLSFIAWFFSIMILAEVLNPNIKSGVETKSLVFYGDIAENTDYYSEMQAQNAMFIENDLSKQIKTVSQIAKWKFERLKVAINSFYIFIVLLVIALLFSIISSNT